MEGKTCKNIEWEQMMGLIRKKPKLFQEVKMIITKVENEDFDLD